MFLGSVTVIFVKVHCFHDFDIIMHKIPFFSKTVTKFWILAPLVAKFSEKSEFKRNGRNHVKPPYIVPMFLVELVKIVILQVLTKH